VLNEYLESIEGYKNVANRDIGKVKGKIIFFKFTFLSAIRRSAPTKTVKEPAFNSF